MTGLGPALSKVASADLERLLAELSALDPRIVVARPILAASRLGHLWGAIHGMGTFDPVALATIVRAVLSERAARSGQRIELVWTGLEAKTAYARPTSAVVRELFENAESHVLLAGYSFDHGQAIFEPLHATMLQRHVAVDIYLHIERADPGHDVAHHVASEVATFFATNWPFGTPHPIIYIAPRTIDPVLHESLHAKCVVVDERVALVGSANFTDRGHSRNIEVGARIEDPGFARALVGQFRAATNAGVFEKYEGVANG